MAKKKPVPLDETNSIAGPGFRLSTEKNKKSRGRNVDKIIAQMSARGTIPANNWLVFADERKLADFTKRRVRTTISKFMASIAVAYAFRSETPRLVVGGARDQYLTGNSGHVMIDGRSHLRGTQAAHFAIGTLWRGSDSIAREAYNSMTRTMKEKGEGNNSRLHDALPASSKLVKLLLAYDASTYQAPAFINQSDGVLEVVKQHFMLGLMPTSIPSDQKGLQLDLRVMGNRLIWFFLNRRINVAPIDKRLRDFKSGAAKAYLQDPGDLESLLLYGGDEEVYLGESRDKLSNSNSDVTTEITSLGCDTHHSAEEFSQLAEAAREEQSES